MRSHEVTARRFYYQTYTPATATAAPSHKNLLRMYYQVRQCECHRGHPDLDTGRPRPTLESTTCRSAPPAPPPTSACTRSPHTSRCPT